RRTDAEYASRQTTPALEDVSTSIFYDDYAQATRLPTSDQMTRRSYEHHLPPRELWPTIVRDTPELRYPPMLNLATALLDTHVEHGASKRTAIVGNDGRMTYGDLQ